MTDLTRSAAFAISLALASCSSAQEDVSAPPASATPPSPSVPLASATSTATVPVEPPAAPVEKPFALVVQAPPHTSFSFMGDTLGYIVIDSDRSTTGPLVAAFELVGKNFVQIGQKTVRLGMMEGASALERDRDTTYLAVVAPNGRTASERYVTLKGPGARGTVSDNQAGYWTQMMAHFPPGCGEPSRDNGLDPMAGTKDTADGHGLMFIVGSTCEDKTKEAVQIVAPGKKPKFLPVQSGARLFAVQNDVYLVTNEIARWESDAFSKKTIPRPNDDKIDSLYHAPDGALVAVTSRHKDSDKSSPMIWSVSLFKEGTWRQLRLDDEKAEFGLVQGPKSLWAISSKGGVYRYLMAGESKPEVADFSMFEGEDSKWKVNVVPAFSSGPPGPHCFSNVAVLYGFTKQTPDDYDFPLTRKALKGHQEAELVQFAVVEERGKKYFVALSTDFGPISKIAKLVEKGVEGSKPQVVCTQPKILRGLKFDWKTGDVVK